MNLTDLTAFVGDAYVPFGFGGWLSMSGAAFGFWCVVAAACLLVLLLAVARHLQTRPRTAAA
jgi:hypothetical protein